MVVLLPVFVLLYSISYFKILIFEPVSKIVQMEGSYHLRSYKH